MPNRFMTKSTHNSDVGTLPVRLSRASRHGSASFGWLLFLGFAVLAVAMFLSSRASNIPIPTASQVNAKELIVAPRRIAMSDPPMILVDGKSQTCNGCHRIFDSAHPSGQMPNFHPSIQLAHGMNDRCVNCHDPSNRERLSLRNGTTVSFAQTPQLCAQCHGTVFRDWERGTHGKTLASWKAASPEQRRLNCNECHDPHSPRYDPIAPLPGPNTLRMGEQSNVAHDNEGKASPLQRWLSDGAAHRTTEKNGVAHE